MQLFHQVLFGNAIQVWAEAGVLAGLALVALLTAKRIVLRKSSELAGRTETILDELLVEVLRSTRLFTLLAAAVYGAGSILSLPPRAERAAGAVMVFCLLLQGAIWTSTAVDFLLRHAIQRREGGDPPPLAVECRDLLCPNCGVIMVRKHLPRPRAPPKEAVL